MTGLEIVLLILLIAVGLVGLALLLIALIQPTRLRVSYFVLNPGRTSESDRTEYSADNHDLSKVSLAKSDSAPRMIYFSDYHAAFMRVPLPTFINAIVKLNPDFVCFGGDLASTKRDLPKALNHLQMISSALMTEGIPFYGVWGNHDRPLSREDTEKRAVMMLKNQCTIFQASNGDDWLIVGLDDERTGTPDFNLARTQILPKARQLHSKNRLDKIPPSRTIVLAHNPDSSLKLPEDSLAWVFSGHYHGGQINLPFRLGYRTLKHDQAWRKGFLKGMYRYKDFGFFISRGIGSVQFPLRLFSAPELSVFDLRSE